jgi:hypothetical protein
VNELIDISFNVSVGYIYSSKFPAEDGGQVQNDYQTFVFCCGREGEIEVFAGNLRVSTSN